MCLVLSLPFLAIGQPQPGLQLIPLEYEAYHPEQTSTLRQQAAGDTLTLPFWDDFSRMFTGPEKNLTFQPDTNLWTVNSRNVRINSGMGINAPTIGVATFDGVDAAGRPYSTNNNNSGLSDSLVSKPVNLAIVPANERDQVFLSFFWQQKGKGEFPDPEDSLRLQFKNRQGQWINQWVQRGGDSLAVNEFKQAILQVRDPSFFHEGFQFRFQSFNRQSAAFDTWNIDYVYLNKNRSASNTAYPDRAFTTLPSSLFKDYTAIPMKAFRESPEAFIGTSSAQFYNLDVQRQAVQFTAVVKNKLTGQPLAVLNQETPLSPLPGGHDRRIITAAPINPASLDLTIDSLYLETEFSLKAADYFLIESINGKDTTFNTSVDFRTNDTVSTTYVLDEYFAYDDGQAELGIEVNQKNGKLAYEFYTPTRLFLTHIDLYFPAINQNLQGALIKFYVWKSLGNDTTDEKVLLQSQASANLLPAATIDNFASFELDYPVSVKDTFYIGYEQLSEQLAAIGFDKNTDSGNKIFFDVTGSWDQNQDLKGSMMLRPRFESDKEPTALPDTSVKVNKASFKVYPNPGNGSVTVEGSHEEVSLLDLTGKEVFHQSYNTPQAIGTFDFSHLGPGIYLLKIRHKSRIHSSKLIIQ